MESKKNKNSVLSKANANDKTINLAEKARKLNVSYLSEAPKKIDRKILKTILESSARKYKMAAFGKDKGFIKVAMVNPQDIEALNVLRFIVEKDKLEVEIYLTSAKILNDIIDQYSTAEKVVEDAVKSLEEDRIDLESGQGIEVVEEESEEDEFVQDAPIAKLVQVVISHAIDGRASDIHIEPIEKEYRVRYRVDGILHASLSLPKSVGKAVVSRIKILSNLKIDEKRKPQDGRFQIIEDRNGEKKAIDFRVSTLPVMNGEKVVMRILEKEDNTFDLEKLGLWGRNYEILTKRIKDPFGIILMTGPTGSGKSTSLYAFLEILNKEERNIVTLEDPVEYFVEGINQSQIRPEIKYTFANGLRSILRQDPNVIMVGEIRDTETAELAIHAALTGHLIFSTVHTNDSIGTIPRLIDMGVEPFLLASSLRVVAAQRLVRRICEHCKVEVKIPDTLLKEALREIENIPQKEIKKYKVDLTKKIKFHRGKGCEECGNLGFKGRLAIYEALEVNDRIQEIMSERHNSELRIREESRKQGMITLRQDGILKAIRGLTTYSEVERMTEDDSTIGGDLTDDKG